jgi:hypothetical protein
MHSLEQTSQRYGHRISILGLWQPGEGFEYALAQGGFKGKSYIEVMDWVAQKAAQSLAETGRITVIVQDNGSLHICQAGGGLTARFGCSASNAQLGATPLEFREADHASHGDGIHSASIEAL